MSDFYKLPSGILIRRSAVVQITPWKGGIAIARGGEITIPPSLEIHFRDRHINARFGTYEDALKAADEIAAPGPLTPGNALGQDC